MNDYTISENLFKDEQDEIHFDLFKESNVIKINNNNNGINDNFNNGMETTFLFLQEMELLMILNQLILL